MRAPNRVAMRTCRWRRIATQLSAPPLIYEFIEEIVIAGVRSHNRSPMSARHQVNARRWMRPISSHFRICRQGRDDLSSRNFKSSARANHIGWKQPEFSTDNNVSNCRLLKTISERFIVQPYAAYRISAFCNLQAETHHFAVGSKPPWHLPFYLHGSAVVRHRPRPILLQVYRPVTPKTDK